MRFWEPADLFKEEKVAVTLPRGAQKTLSAASSPSAA
jgi:hypothetical protein